MRRVEDLVETYDRGAEIAACAARARNLPVEGLDLDLAAGAAFCLRHREVAAEQRRDRSRSRVREARARGEAWVVIDEPRPWLEHPFPPWRSVHMHLPDGVGLHIWVEESLDSVSGMEFGVETVELDPESGQWLDGRAPADTRTFHEYGPWQQAIAQLKARYDR